MKKLIFLLFLALATPLFSSDAFAACPCDETQCSRSPLQRDAIKKLRQDLRRQFYPEHLIQLTARISPRSQACLDSIERKFKIRTVLNTGALSVREWSPPLERSQRRALKEGRIKAFYIYINGGKKCTCCDTGSYKDQSDYDEDLDINRNGPVIIFEDLSNVGGTTPGRYGDEASNHYAPRAVPYPEHVYYPKPRSPRPIQSKCAECTQKSASLNSVRRQNYGFMHERYELSREIQTAAEVMSGIHLELVALYKNASLTEAAFYNEREQILERYQDWELLRLWDEDRLVYVNKELVALAPELQRRDDALDKCEASDACQKHTVRYPSPKPIQDVACNKITEDEYAREDYSAHLKDLVDLDVYLERTKSNWIGCRDRFNCPKISCKKSESTRDRLHLLPRRVNDLLPWAEKFKSSALRYAKTLNEVNQQTQTQLNRTEWAQSVHTEIHRVSTMSTAISDLHRTAKDLANGTQGTPTGPQNETRRKKILENLDKLDTAYQTVMTSLGFINDLTWGVEMPLSEEKGLPGIRRLSDFRISILVCLTAVASELKEMIKNIKNNKPGWKTNLLAFIAKGGQCYSTIVQHDRDIIMDDLRKSAELEYQGLLKAQKDVTCLSRRHEKLKAIFPVLQKVQQEMHGCTTGQCGRVQDPGNPVPRKTKTYGKALSILEPIIRDYTSELVQAYQDDPTHIAFEESPDPTLQTRTQKFLPYERIYVDFEMPWCLIDAAWIGMFPTAGPDRCSQQSCGNIQKVSLREAEGRIAFRAPTDIGRYELTLYNNGTQGIASARKAFDVANYLGNLVDSQNLFKVYRGQSTQNNIPPREFNHPIADGKGRVIFHALNDRGDRLGGHRKIIGPDGKRIYSGYDEFKDLEPGQYSFVFKGYTPEHKGTFTIVEGQRTIAKVDGYGRFKVLAFTGDGNQKKPHIEIWDGDGTEIYGGYGPDVLMPPGTYQVKIGSYIPHIRYHSLKVEENHTSTMVIDGYGTLEFKPLDHKGETHHTWRQVFRVGDNARVYTGYNVQVDIEPGSYWVNYSAYVPEIQIHNMGVTKGRKQTATTPPVGGFKRPSGKYYYIYNAQDKRVYSGYNEELELLPGLYYFQAASGGNKGPKEPFVIEAGKVVTK